MNRILVYAPYEDRAGRAISLAAKLARREGAQLTILRVLEHGIGWSPEMRSEERLHRTRRLLREAETHDIESLAASLCSGCRDVTVKVSWGVPWEVIVNLVETGAFDVVVKPARGLGQAGHVFFGSTALHLFRKCHCPVWVVGDEGRLPAKILAAIDPASDPTRRAVARSILDLAHRVAEHSHSTVHVVAAWNAPGAHLLKGTIPEADLNAYVEDALRISRESLDLILNESATSLPPDQVHLINGNARDALAPFANHNGFDLIVMGTLGRTGVAGELLGETAELIVRAVRSSVLTVAPPRPS